MAPNNIIRIQILDFLRIAYEEEEDGYTDLNREVWLCGEYMRTWHHPWPA